MANVQTASNFSILYAGFSQHFPGVILQNSEDYKTSYKIHKRPHISDINYKIVLNAFKEPSDNGVKLLDFILTILKLGSFKV